MSHSRCWGIGRVDGLLRDGIFQEGTTVTQVCGGGGSYRKDTWSRGWYFLAMSYSDGG